MHIRPKNQPSSLFRVGNIDGCGIQPSPHVTHNNQRVGKERLIDLLFVQPPIDHINSCFTGNPLFQATFLIFEANLKSSTYPPPLPAQKHHQLPVPIKWQPLLAAKLPLCCHQKLASMFRGVKRKHAVSPPGEDRAPAEPAPP